MNYKWGNVRVCWNSNLSVTIITDQIKNANGFTMHLPLNSIAKLMLWCTIGPVCIVSWFWLWFLELIQDKGVFPSWWGLVLFRAIIMFSTCTLILRSPQPKEYIFSEWKNGNYSSYPRLVTYLGTMDMQEDVHIYMPAAFWVEALWHFSSHSLPHECLSPG